MTNPIDNYLEDKIKAAAPIDWAGGLRRAAETAVPAMAVGGGLAMLAGASGKTYNAIMKSRRFRQMLEANPDLHEHQQANPDQFDRHYSALYSLNPRFAAEPTVAGTYMRQMSMNPATAGKVVVESLHGVPDGGHTFQIGTRGGIGREGDFEVAPSVSLTRKT